MSVVLEARDVWKAYPSWRPGSRTVRGIVARRAPLLMRGVDPRWVLREVNLAVRTGESVGVIGHNGAGKSTLLRLCSGLGRVTRGTITRPPRVASVLSLGSWFDHTLSGRENAETAAVVLGWTRAQAKALVPAVLEFAELHDFADAPVRVYSDGMRLRLAFGVIAQLQPDLLVIDEALAVGDVAFQERCVERIHEMREAGAALLLASHDLGRAAEECDRIVWLHRGEVRYIGDAEAAVEAYRDAGRLETLARTPPATAEAPDLGDRRLGSQELTVEPLALIGADGKSGGEMPSGAPLSVALELRPKAGGIANPIVLVEVHRASDALLCYEASSEAAGVRTGPLDGPVRVTVTADRLDLVPGDYFVTVGVYTSDWEYAYDYRWRLFDLRIAGVAGGHGVLSARHRWEVGAPPARTHDRHQPA